MASIRGTPRIGTSGSPVGMQALAAFVLLAAAFALLSPGHASTTPPARTSMPPAPANSLPTPIQHVVLVILENQDATSVLSGGAFEKHLSTTYSYATHDYAVCHPSAPNYLALTSGSRYSQCGSDAWNVVKATNLGDLLDTAGLSWAAFEESMPKPCDTSDAYPYAVKHNPFVYYSDVVKNASRCQAHDLNFTSWHTDVSLGTIPNFSLVVPNLKDDGHDTGVAYADSWLKGWLSPLLNASWFARTAFLITYDEGSASSSSGFNGLDGGNVYLDLVSPYSEGVGNITTDVAHYNTLTTVEWLLGLGSTGHNDSAGNYPPLKAAFRFSSSGPSHYPVDFVASGLPTATAWSVELGTDTNASSTDEIGFTERNGSYGFNVTAPTGYVAAPPNGTVHVAGQAVTVPVAFHPSSPPPNRTFNVSIQIDPAGCGPIDIDGREYASGSSASLAADTFDLSAPNCVGHDFYAWTAGAGAAVGAPGEPSTLLTVWGNGSLLATFHATSGGGGPSGSFRVVLEVSPPNCPAVDFNGSSFANGSGPTVPAGSYPALAPSCSGYQFSSWLAAGSVVPANASRASTDVNVTGNGTLTAAYISSIETGSPGGGSSPPTPGSPPLLGPAVIAGIGVVGGASVAGWVLYRRHLRTRVPPDRPNPPDRV